MKEFTIRGRKVVEADFKIYEEIRTLYPMVYAQFNLLIKKMQKMQKRIKYLEKQIDGN